jgi:hypothetical protein
MIMSRSTGGPASLMIIYAWSLERLIMSAMQAWAVTAHPCQGEPVTVVVRAVDYRAAYREGAAALAYKIKAGWHVTTRLSGPAYCTQ